MHPRWMGVYLLGFIIQKKTACFNEPMPCVGRREETWVRRVPSWQQGFALRNLTNRLVDLRRGQG